MRAMLAICVALAGCAPAVVHDTELDALGFVAGCWSQWSVDWGFTLCWQRHGDRWIGELESRGAMGPAWHLRFAIARDGSQLAWTAPAEAWFVKHPIAELDARGSDIAIFGSPDAPVDRVLALDRVHDQLVFQPSAREPLYRLVRQR